MQNKSPAGHRKRLRRKYLSEPPEQLKKEELAELLLFYAIKRRDTSPLASELVKRFGGDFHAMLASDAVPDGAPDGTGETVKELFALFSELKAAGYLETPEIEEYEGSEIPAGLFRTKALARQFSEEADENVLLGALVFNSGDVLVSSHVLAESFADIRNAEPGGIVKSLLRNGATSVIVVRCSRSGYVPKQEDIDAIETLYSLFESASLALRDYVIVSREGSLSLANDYRYFELFNA